ncbi:MAG: OmpA family protein, partial [Spirochaetales bacterium]|nr:OmpA family protein [Spirochaetales bacterium]
ALYTKLFDKKKAGDTVELQGIYFDSHDQLWQQGVTRITSLAKVLAQNKYVIAIGCYAEALNNPDKEISIAKKRSQRIKDLLISKGISPDRIKINANATVYPEGTPTSEKKIEIKIIK